MANAGSVQATVGIAPPGTRLDIVYLRDGRERSTALTVEDNATGRVQAGGDTLQAFGAQFRAIRPADDRGDETGVIVASVEGGSDAAQKGLKAGDVVTAVAERATTDLAALAAALEADQGATTLHVRRDGEMVEVVVGE